MENFLFSDKFTKMISGFLVIGIICYILCSLITGIPSDYKTFLLCAIAFSFPLLVASSYRKEDKLKLIAVITMFLSVVLFIILSGVIFKVIKINLFSLTFVDKADLQYFNIFMCGVYVLIGCTVICFSSNTVSEYDIVSALRGVIFVLTTLIVVYYCYSVYNVIKNTNIVTCMSALTTITGVLVAVNYALDKVSIFKEMFLYKNRVDELNTQLNTARDIMQKHGLKNEADNIKVISQQINNSTAVVVKSQPQQPIQQTYQQQPQQQYQQGMYPNNMYQNANAYGYQQDYNYDNSPIYQQQTQQYATVHQPVVSNDQIYQQQVCANGQVVQVAYQQQEVYQQTVVPTVQYQQQPEQGAPAAPSVINPKANAEIKVPAIVPSQQVTIPIVNQ